MDKDTALERLDALRELVERLPKDAEVVSVDLGFPFSSTHPVSVLVYDLATSGIEGECTVVGNVFSDISDERYEHRFYPAQGMENAGYRVLVAVPDMRECEACEKDTE